MDEIRVLVVDDSAFARSMIVSRLESDPAIKVIGQARDGIEAVRLTNQLNPSVVTMDVAMPQMDGLAALRQIMQDCPTPIVMLSALTGSGTDVTIKALELGAVDFFLKPSITNPAGVNESTLELIQKIKVAARAKLSLLAAKPSSAPQQGQPSRKSKQRSMTINRAVVIASSTGGPKALSELIPLLPADLPAFVLIVQHMPPGFTRSLSERLNQISEVEVREARAGVWVEPGVALMAPGDYHMTLGMDGKIALNQNPPECGVRPCANITIESVAQLYGSRSIIVVLTGMGSDGTRASKLVKDAGGTIIAQNEATCAVYGMPASVVDVGITDSVLPLTEIAYEITRLCQQQDQKSRTTLSRS